MYILVYFFDLLYALLFYLIIFDDFKISDVQYV